MRRSGTKVIIVVVLLGTSSGCGTLLNVGGRERLDLGSIDAPPERMRKYERPAFVFGGVANDVAWIKSAEQPIDVIASLVDLPFSLAGDIVTLPWITFEYAREKLQPSDKYDSSRRSLADVWRWQQEEPSPNADRSPR